MAAKHALLVIIGSTASGKSALALEIARRRGAHLLSADSMQVYRGMNIGTAKPTAAELAMVRHYGIDLVDPDELYTVAQFVEMADAAIAQCRQEGVPLVVTGGTPLYYKALFEGLFNGPGADDAVRVKLAEQSNEELHARLSAVDPPAAVRIHLRDTRRLIRALEVFELTGKPISSMQSQWEAGEGAERYAGLWIGLDWDKAELNRRINARVKAMLANGWVQEARELLDRYGTLSKTASGATGYQQLIDHLAGRTSLEDAVEQIKIQTRQLARKQMKWFRRFKSVIWLKGEIGAENASEVLAKWQ